MLGWEFPPFISGGLGIHCYELTKALAKKGVDIDFYMPKTDAPVDAPWMNVIRVPNPGRPRGMMFGPYMGGPRPATVPSGKAKRAKEFFSPDFFGAVCEYNALAAEALVEMDAERNYDVIHGHDWITMKAGTEAKRRTKKPLTFFVHSTEYDRTANLSPFRWIVDIEQEGMDAADIVMTNSRMMARQLNERYRMAPAKMRVVYNAVDAEKFRTRQRLKRELFGTTGRVVLFHGRLTIQKGPDFFIQAARRVLEKEPDTKFVVSGKGDFLPRLVNMALDLGIEDKVIFSGRVPEDKLPALYAASDVYVLPSVSEPFGITVLEAMAAGTPVIVSKTTGASEVVNHCLRVDFWDVDELANKIIGLLRYSELRDLLREGGEEEARRFSWDSVADETIAVYNELAAMRGRK